MSYDDSYLAAAINPVTNICAIGYLFSPVEAVPLYRATIGNNW